MGMGSALILGLRGCGGGGVGDSGARGPRNGGGVGESTISEWGSLKCGLGRRTRRTCVELVVELVVFYVVLVELVENKDLIHKSL